MENNHFIDIDELKVNKERPSFLTVLCIITFVVSGIWFLASFFGAVTYDELAQQEAMELAIVSMEKSMASQPDNAIADMMVDSFVEMGNDQLQYHKIINWSTVISTLLSLIGAFLMFNMKKIGFHVYLVSKIVGLIPLLVISLNAMVISIYVMFGVLTITFLIMYAVNLKHIKNGLIEN